MEKDKSTSSMGRMLLAHNFDLHNNELPTLSKEEFAKVFVDGLREEPNITCSQIENPHWVVEIIFPTTEFEAETIGKMCGDVLINNRKNSYDDNTSSQLTINTLMLGGKKTTPASGTSTTSLQPGEWGVDVVETSQGDAFLESINWHNLTAGKSGDRIFKIEFRQD